MSPSTFAWLLLLSSVVLFFVVLKLVVTWIEDWYYGRLNRHTFDRWRHESRERERQH